ncbi:hypothetical protein PPTG_23499 [Phytophthora nicotianae INRA-310]|uniref:Uncharacterized protein n=1 Tax=Phytophthora nicotianae (strain INRA-310) TaxID=761204 RepID=W2PWL3_PHYN3|nr:hypothetical protein PPTG_23499 [Phytophthora nicotianae INRA-310]ETN05338.1 hypothetical protein PPTG_23499 [Phytophthora nicotianae INRA-310]
MVSQTTPASFRTSLALAHALHASTSSDFSDKVFSILEYTNQSTLEREPGLAVGEDGSGAFSFVFLLLLGLDGGNDSPHRITTVRRDSSDIAPADASFVGAFDSSSLSIR